VLARLSREVLNVIEGRYRPWLGSRIDIGDTVECIVQRSKYFRRTGQVVRLRGCGTVAVELSGDLRTGAAREVVNMRFSDLRRLGRKVPCA
jgi:hypothetical protein